MATRRLPWPTAPSLLTTTPGTPHTLPQWGAPWPHQVGVMCVLDGEREGGFWKGFPKGGGEQRCEGRVRQVRVQHQSTLAGRIRAAC